MARRPLSMSMSISIVSGNIAPGKRNYVARWSRRQRDVVVIADGAGRAVASFPVSGVFDRPDWKALLKTGWGEFPGASWQEGPEGVWSVAVFNHDLMRREAGGEADGHDGSGR